MQLQGAKSFYKKSAAEQERLKLSEVKHARLAMLAIIGELTQMMMFHKVQLVRLLRVPMSFRTNFPPLAISTYFQLTNRPRSKRNEAAIIGRVAVRVGVVPAGFT